jgi:hypothetical protein
VLIRAGQVEVDGRTACVCDEGFFAVAREPEGRGVCANHVFGMDHAECVEACQTIDCGLGSCHLVDGRPECAAPESCGLRVCEHGGRCYMVAGRPTCDCEGTGE